MAETTNISWCDATVNFWWGCTKVSPGCLHCYADTLAHRWGKDIWGKGKPREDHRAGARKLAIKLDAQARREGRRLRVFSASMSDWLDDEVPIEWLADLLAVIHETPNLSWLLLTKRPENWKSRIAAATVCMSGAAEQWAGNWLLWKDAPVNVWIGTTVENQTRGDDRIPELLKIPAKVRFLSCEPLLGPVDLHEVWSPKANKPALEDGSLHWVICGGESGRGAREMKLEWAESLRVQCAAAGVAFFMKQLGGARDKRHELHQLPESLRVRQFPV